MPKGRGKGQRMNVEIKYSGTIEDRENQWGKFISNSINEQIRKSQQTKKVEEPKQVEMASFPKQNKVESSKVNVEPISEFEIDHAINYMNFQFDKELYELQTEIEQLEREYEDEYEAAFDCDEGWYVECERCGNNRLKDRFEDHCTCCQTVIWERKVVYC